jgi:hypothetical protein
MRAIVTRGHYGLKGFHAFNTIRNVYESDHNLRDQSVSRMGLQSPMIVTAVQNEK